MMVCCKDHEHLMNYFQRFINCSKLCFQPKQYLMTCWHFMQDFGLARRMCIQDGLTFYQPSTICGTLPWMAPEQVCVNASHEFWGDVFVFSFTDEFEFVKMKSYQNV